MVRSPLLLLAVAAALTLVSIPSARAWCGAADKSLPQPCGPGGRHEQKWCDASLPNAARVAALVAGLSVEEKAAMLLAEGPAPIGSLTGPVERLSYPRVHWWHEALHGVYWPGSGLATSWPQVISHGRYCHLDAACYISLALHCI
jgi:hypothetical protein